MHDYKDSRMNSAMLSVYIQLDHLFEYYLWCTTLYVKKYIAPLSIFYNLRLVVPTFVRLSYSRRT